MYLVIWGAFLQILIIFFPVLGSNPTFDLHFLVGIVVLVLAYYVYLQVRKTSCPERIKRITKTTAYLGALQGVLGVLLYLASRLGVGLPFEDFFTFIHLVLAITIITQASSSATAFDMWEEKEFYATGTQPSV